MGDDYNFESKAPFNMAIATLMSLRQTLDRIRDIEGRIDFPPYERQRIKIELVKRFYVDSSPLLEDNKVIEKFDFVLSLTPIQVICVDSSTQKRKPKSQYSPELNEQLDRCLLQLQVALQKRGYYMPPRDDMGSIGLKMS